MSEVNRYAPGSGKMLRSDNSEVNAADGINDDGSRNVVLKGSNVELLNTITTVGDSVVKPVEWNRTLRIEVWGTGTFGVQIQGVGSSGTPRALPVWDIRNKIYLTNNQINTAGFYDIDVRGMVGVNAKVTNISGGNVNASGVFLQ